MLRNGDTIKGYTILAVANNVVMARSATAADPYVVWCVDADNGVHTGAYRQNKQEAEQEFCSRAFPWFQETITDHRNAEKDVEIDQDQIESFKRYIEQARDAINLAEIEFSEIISSITE